MYHAVAEEWTSILKIACAYDFHGIKDLAVRGLESCDMSIANRIRLYQRYDVDSRYINSLYVKFCLRDEGPTEEETEIMGTKVSLNIYMAREHLRRSSCATVQHGSRLADLAESDVLEAISSILCNNAPSQDLGLVYIFSLFFIGSVLWIFS